MITQQIKLNLIPGQVFPRVNASQYDSGTRTLQMALYNGDQVFNIASGMTAVVQGTKPDKTGFQYAATITEGSNIATLDITQQMTAVKGDVTCELVISNGNNRIATVNFILYVEAAALAGDTVISETDLPLIEEAAELAERIDGIVQQVDEDAQTASNAATAAQRASEAATNAQDAAEESADKAEAYGTHPPYIGANGNWFVYNVTTQQYEDSGVKAQGPLSGLTDVEISNPAENDIIAYDATAQKWKNSSEFETLTNEVAEYQNIYGAKNILNFRPEDVYSYQNYSYAWDSTDSAYKFTSTGDYGRVGYWYPNILTIGRRYKVKAKVKFTKADSTNTMVELNTTTSFAYNYGILFDEHESTSNFIDCEKTITAETTGLFLGIYVQYGNGSGNIIEIKDLMIYDVDASMDDTYAPYAKTNQQLTEDTIALLDNTEVNGAVNMLPITATTQTVDGITFTVNDDGSITADGTATNNTSLYVSYGSPDLIGKTVKLSGCPSGGATSSYYMRAYRVGSADGSTGTYTETGDGVTFTWENDGSGTRAYIAISIKSGVTVSNLTFKPMITIASYNGDYVPYAKSNKKLTEDLEIEDITSNFYSSLGTGVTVLSDSGVWKQGKHIFGKVIFNISNGLTANELFSLFTLATRPAKSLNTYCIGMTQEYQPANAEILYAYFVSSSGIVQIRSDVGGATYIRLDIDYVTT